MKIYLRGRVVGELKRPRRSKSKRRSSVRRRANPVKTMTLAQKLSRVRRTAYSASIHRLYGRMRKAQEYDKKLDKMVWTLERAGYSDEAFEAEEEGREMARDDYPKAKRKRNSAKSRRKKAVPISDAGRYIVYAGKADSNGEITSWYKISTHKTKRAAEIAEERLMSNSREWDGTEIGRI